MSVEQKQVKDGHKEWIEKFYDCYNRFRFEAVERLLDASKLVFDAGEGNP